MRRKFHALKKPKIRASWNKHNLYNLSQLTHQNLYATFFQQKWTAKSISRAYHGEQIREKQWQRMFRPRLAAVVPMDHRYLARFDGSEQALGRGSGLDVNPNAMERLPKQPRRTPYVNMVYAPIERRLDTAIFRALFASSAKQARQMVVHGFVRVNGKKMIYPGYMLNPGDMFQVDPERVLYATGAPKTTGQNRWARRQLRKGENASKDDSVTPEASASEEHAENSETANEGKDVNVSNLLISDDTAPSSNDPAADLITRAREAITMTDEGELSAKRKRAFRKLKQSLKDLIVKREDAAASTISAFQKELDDFNEVTKASSVLEDAQPSDKIDARKVAKETELLKQWIQQVKENPIDPRKPYGTPWRPRDYMSAFAFIPRYLEVNQNICSAVYLRHPVARPGLSEIPGPFDIEVYQLAFNWYLRRGR